VDLRRSLFVTVYPYQESSEIFGGDVLCVLIRQCLMKWQSLRPVTSECLVSGSPLACILTVHPDE
jgi:hypothetical protein